MKWDFQTQPADLHYLRAWKAQGHSKQINLVWRKLAAYWIVNSLMNALLSESKMKYVLLHNYSLFASIPLTIFREAFFKS